MSLIWADRVQDIGGEKVKKIDEQRKKSRSKQRVLCREQLVKETRGSLFENKERAKQRQLYGLFEL
ncbi:hypothetical protein [Brevibacillus laterosporus]|uniref:hypothetical protein n=1 Tax=Brevibacillus laterosporus TaxID=1465 RepID=UPI001EF3B382|nr:hypothetical protein [Brevibacillus laterosporus]MCG7317892.1 hypothetical protein [Brevibacillus laterosporus]